ncbi:MAG: NUDIX hydrolase [Bacilli bacterium]|nr:NUDIX hydrolase [Bacilli bacterium]
MDLKETKVESEVIYSGKIIDVYKDKVVLPNGTFTYREYIKHCKASCVLARLPNGKFLVEKQFRYPYQEVLYEFPAGKCDENEEPIHTALRELEEETGYKASKITYLGLMYPTCAYSDEIIYLYFAESLSKTSQNLDENENVEVIELSYEEIINLIKKGELKDAKSLCLITYLQNSSLKIGN